jgi:hypothetical protein
MARKIKKRKLELLFKLSTFMSNPDNVVLNWVHVQEDKNGNHVPWGDQRAERFCILGSLQHLAESIQLYNALENNLFHVMNKPEFPDVMSGWTPELLKKLFTQTRRLIEKEKS